MAGEQTALQMVKTGVTQAVKSPNYWLSFMQTAGPLYNEALEEGANPVEATMTAMLGSTGNALLEVGMGTEKLAYEATQGQAGIRQWLTRSLEEGGENWLQGALTRATQKMIYDSEKAWFSAEDQDAVFSLSRGAQELGSGFVISGFLNGATLGLQKLKGGLKYDGSEIFMDMEAGKTCKTVTADGETAGYVHIRQDGTIDGLSRLGADGQPDGAIYVNTEGEMRYGHPDLNGEWIDAAYRDGKTGKEMTAEMYRERGEDALRINLEKAARDKVDIQQQTEMLSRELAGQFQQAQLQQARPALEQLAGQYNDANTAQAFMDGYDGGLPLNIYEAGFHTVYQMAQQGMDFETAMTQSGQYGHMLTTQQAQLAYNAGAAEFEAEVLPNGGDGDRINNNRLEIERTLQHEKLKPQINANPPLHLSECTQEDLMRYLRKTLGEEAEKAYQHTETWPEELMIPKSAAVLKEDGSINWDMAPQNGFVVDQNGQVIKEMRFPKIGEIIDRYGSSNGRFVSPVVDGKPFSFDQRSLPYVEDSTQYHQYEVIGDFSKLEEYVDSCADEKLKKQIYAHIVRYYGGDYRRLVVCFGKIAGIEGWGSGGGIQYEFPLPINWLEKIGVLKEIIGG